MPIDESRETEAALRGAGLRVTRTRRAVLDVLRTLPHARADDVFDRVRESVPATSLQSVYNALGDFVEVGLARRIEPEGHPGLFELRVADNHHHIVCRACGRVEDVDCTQGRAPCLHPAPDQTHGFTVQAAEVTFWGLCPECAAADHSPSRSTKGT